MKLNDIIRKYFTPPADFTSEQQRFFALSTTMGAMCFIYHIVFIFLFQWMDLQILVLQSILALIVWTLFIWLGRKGQIGELHRPDRQVVHLTSQRNRAFGDRRQTAEPIIPAERDRASLGEPVGARRVSGNPRTGRNLVDQTGRLVIQ